MVHLVAFSITQLWSFLHGFCGTCGNMFGPYPGEELLVDRCCVSSGLLDNPRLFLK